MKKLLSLFLVSGLLVLYGSFSAQAISLGLSPSSQTVLAGDTVSMDVVISGLGDFAPDSLSAFDLDISFDPSILSYSGVTFGDPVLGDQLDLFSLGSFGFDSLVGPGTLNIFELSLDFPWDLDTLQSGAFTLATLTFDSLSLGTSSLGISINALGDAWGDPLSASVTGGSVMVTPEPGTLLLLGSGLAGLALLRRRKSKVKR